MATKDEIKDFLAGHNCTPVPKEDFDCTPDEDLFVSLRELQKIGFTVTMLINEISDGRLKIIGPPVPLDLLPKADGEKLPFDCMFVSAANMEEWIVNSNVPAWIKDTVEKKMAESW